MKIDRVETRIVHAASRNWVFVLVGTDGGASGLGEATLEWRTRAVAACVEDLRGWVLGLDASDPVRVRDEVALRSFYPQGPVQASALSGIDQALWDLAGKREGRPVWQLLRERQRRGGLAALPPRRELPAYLNLAGGGPATRDAVRKAREAGWEAVKWKPIPPGWRGSDPDPDRVLADVEEALALGITGVALDLHGRCEAGAGAALVERLARSDAAPRILFVEEPCRPDDLAGLASVRAAAGGRIAIAGGERLPGSAAFEPLVARGLVDLLQPDVIHAGGITEVLRIAARAAAGTGEGGGLGEGAIALAPHCAAGPVALAASVQLGFALPGVRFQECFLRDAPWRDDVVEGGARPRRGRFGPPPPAAPGLGVTFDEGAAGRHPFREVVPPRPLDGRGRLLPW